MIRFIQKFIAQEFAGGVLLFIAAVLAMVVVNSPFESYYIHFLELPASVQIGAAALNKPLLLWINDGLMAVFFFLVGVEIKRELFEGELNSWNKAILPLVAALGGMLVPSLIFAAINHHDAVALRGWAIPSATDIAFALAVLGVFSSRIPFSLKIFLTALAILDDLGAIVIIAIFYTDELSWLSLLLGGICTAALFILNRLNVTKFAPYGIIGIILWVCVLKSGVHATLAGVILAFAYPLRDKKMPHIALSHQLESSLLPWVNYAILPLFAFANAGIPFDNVRLSTIVETIPLGIMLGLFLGKQVGILGACWLAIKTKLASMPEAASWRHLYAVALICGIGFTMSLFIGSLAYDGRGLHYVEVVRIGVVLGSVLSAVIGSLFIWLFCPRIKGANNDINFSRDH